VIATADSVAAVQEAVLASDRLLPVGAQTKPALAGEAGPDTVLLHCGGLSGISAYDPAELTLTAAAGTPITELADALAAHGQYLPFDPPLAAAGATLAGTVAAGLSGPGAQRYGGVRDFIIGVELVDGRGRHVHGGGRVVKNAAGFDLPKLMVGSLGRLGVIVAVSLKVFPRARAHRTLAAAFSAPADARDTIAALNRGPLALEAIDLSSDGRLLVRLGGSERTLASLTERAEAIIGVACERIDGAEEATLWAAAAAFAWLPGDRDRDREDLIRIPLTPPQLPALSAALTAAGARHRFSRSASVAWAHWPADRTLAELADLLSGLRLGGERLWGRPGPPLLGAVPGGAFAERVRAALDPDGRFPEL
jgi:glycolate oxidase FAD binding subunit